MKRILLTYLTTAFASAEDELSIRELVHNLGNVQKSWQSGHNSKFNLEHKISDYDYLNGVLNVTKIGLLERPVADYSTDVELPENFDWRLVAGEMCPSLLEIRDQGSCGSCWAFGAVESFTDRLCIQSKGQYTADMSAEDLLSCCGLTCGFGCNGGDLTGAWEYIARHGICTGGLYQGSGCRPYSIPPHTHNSISYNYDTPECVKECQTSYTANTYADDKISGVNAYAVPSLNVAAIQQEILENGPVEASFMVYEDFYAYKGGVYYYVYGKPRGAHAVKVLGWGVDGETGLEYWLAANSWNTGFGIDGFFKIRRGTNECQIEVGMHAGMAI